MGDELLDAIFALENEIQLQLQDEKRRAERWLAGVRAEQEQLLEAGRKEAEAARQRALDAARRQGEEQAALIEAAEQADCARLAEISDSVLQEVLDRQLTGILPGRANDHQNGES